MLCNTLLPSAPSTTLVSPLHRRCAVFKSKSPVLDTPNDGWQCGRTFVWRWLPCRNVGHGARLRILGRLALSARVSSFSSCRSDGFPTISRSYKIPLYLLHPGQSSVFQLYASQAYPPARTSCRIEYMLQMSWSLTRGRQLGCGTAVLWLRTLLASSLEGRPLISM